MSDRVTISNLALSKLGENNRLIDPGDNTKPARAIAAIWDVVRLGVLRSANWNCATQRFALPALAGISADDIYPYSYAYEPPANALRFVDLIDNTVDQSDYIYEGNRILSNISAPLRCRWVIDQPDTSQWDALLTEAFACLLAFEIADEITGDRGRRSDCWANYQKALSDAKAVDAIENPPIDEPESSWIAARFGFNDSDFTVNGVWVR